MKQQINLYQPIFRKQRTLLSSRTILQMLGLVILALAIIYAIGYWQLHQLNVDIAKARMQQDQSTRELVHLQKTLPPRSPSPILAERLRKETAERNGKRAAIVALGNRQLGSTKGFDAQLAGLARQRVRGLWLTAIQFSRGGTGFTLEGASSTAPLVPRYLQKLAAEPTLQGVEFKTMRIERSKHEAYLAFELSTREPTEDKRHEGTLDTVAGAH